MFLLYKQNMQDVELLQNEFVTLKLSFFIVGQTSQNEKWIAKKFKYIFLN